MSMKNFNILMLYFNTLRFDGMFDVITVTSVVLNYGSIFSAKKGFPFPIIKKIGLFSTAIKMAIISLKEITIIGEFERMFGFSSSHPKIKTFTEEIVNSDGKGILFKN